jgi:hypothetical protein
MYIFRNKSYRQFSDIKFLLHCAPGLGYYWGHGKLGRCVIQLSKFLNHTLATHNQVDSFFENINYNDGKGAFTLTLFEMTG